MKLQFTNGYRPRFDQISRILQYLHAQDGRAEVPRREIVSSLAIPDRQAENLTSMMIGFGLVVPKQTLLTPLGKLVVRCDPYFERLETLWIIHYLVSSNPEWVVWYRIINTVLPSEEDYAIDEVSRRFFSDLAVHFSERTLSEKLPTEVGAVFTAYTRTQFLRLGILRDSGRGHFTKSEPVDVPEEAFLFCLVHFRDTCSPGSSALTTKDVGSAERSPGKVLHLADAQVRTLLGNLHDAGWIRLERFADLDQVRLPDALRQESVLESIYRKNGTA
jgi:hypothetical protein